jgi:hypothetical protein
VMHTLECDCLNFVLSNWAADVRCASRGKYDESAICERLYSPELQVRMPKTQGVSRYVGFRLNADDLPRQARDKHKENSNLKHMFVLCRILSAPASLWTLASARCVFYFVPWPKEGPFWTCPCDPQEESESPNPNQITN